MSNQSVYRLGELVTLKRGYDLPHASRNPGVFPIVSSSGITGTHKEPMVKGPGVVTGRYGTLGEVFYVPEAFWPLNTSLYVQNFKKNDPRFVAYYLRTVLSTSFNSAGAVPGVNRNILHKLAVPPPPKQQENQPKIAAVLTTYDDLIETNKRRIALLEKMAEELYREWFVRMRFPGHQSTRFVKGVPEGWTIQAIGDLCSTVTDGSHFSPPFVEGGKPMASVKDMHTHGFDLKSVKTISETDFETLKKGDCQPLTNDILIAKDGSYLKHVFVWADSYEIVILSSIAILRPDLTKVKPYFFAQVLKQDSTKSMMSGYVSGSALPRIILKDFKKMRILVPTSDLVNRYEELATSFFLQICGLLKANDNLTQTRDLLLPRLISGKLSVEDLDIQFPPSMQEEAA